MDVCDESLARSEPPPLMRLRDALDCMGKGDLLLWRKPGLISLYGRGLHSHAAKYWHNCLFAGPVLMEVREFRGGRVRSLEEEVKAWPGRIEVYQVDRQVAPFYDPDRAMVAMHELIKCRYDYRGVLRAALRRWPLVRYFLPSPSHDCLPLRDYETLRKRVAGGLRVYCSAAVALADMVGGCDPVPNLSPFDTEPADLARSLMYKPLCTLEP